MSDQISTITHWQTMTFIGALRHDRIEAPWVLDGPIDAEAFKTYVRAELVKTLKPDDVAVLDNSPPAGGVRRAPLNSHKGKAARAMVKAIGARLFFLPSSSPDLNPIDPSAALRASRAFDALRSGGLRKNQACDAKGDGPKR
ncbi:MAG: transposase [Methylocella sp.]